MKNLLAHGDGREGRKINILWFSDWNISKLLVKRSFCFFCSFSDEDEDVKSSSVISYFKLLQ